MGFYLIKIIDNIVVACLFVGAEEEEKWWIYSVYTHPHYRRMGHFTTLFNRTVEIAQEKKVKSVKLYVDRHNLKAKQTYFNLGMK